MSYWAQIDSLGTVLRVLVGNNGDKDEGHSWFTEQLGGEWIQTSIASQAGKRIDPDTGQEVSDRHFRYNFAYPGYTYDPDFGPDGAFIPPQPFPSWMLNPDTALWDAPTPMPAEGGPWVWDEPTLSWVEVTA